MPSRLTRILRWRPPLLLGGLLLALASVAFVGVILVLAEAFR